MARGVAALLRSCEMPHLFGPLRWLKLKELVGSLVLFPFERGPFWKPLHDWHPNPRFAFGSEVPGHEQLDWFLLKLLVREFQTTLGFACSPDLNEQVQTAADRFFPNNWV